MTAGAVPPRELGHANVASASIRQLLLCEARRAALSPILLTAFAAACWTMWSDWIEGHPPASMWSTDVYYSLFYNAWPLLFGSFLLGAWTHARERPETTQELFTSAPVSTWHRVAARLAVAAVPALAALVVVGVQALLVTRAGGVPLGYYPYLVQVMPNLVEWASIPVATVASFAAGAAAYTVTRSRVISALIGAFVTFFGVVGFWLVGWPPAGFISPIGVPVPEHELAPSEMPWSSDRPLTPADPVDYPPWRLLDPDPVLDAAHSVALLGMAAIFAAITLERTFPDRRNRRLGWAGAAVVGLASLTQALTYMH